MTASLFMIWILVIPALVSASHRIQFLSKHEDGSVVFFCESENKSLLPIGFYLKRKCPQNDELVFLTPDKPAAEKAAFKGRIHINGDVRTHQVNVTVLYLSHNDSGLYVCEFVFEDGIEFKTVTGQTEYLLYVERAVPPCNCPSYTFLLYAISGATGLFLLIIIGLGTALCCKACHPSKPPNPLPIYEEMTALRPAKDKTSFCHLHPPPLEEADPTTSDRARVRLSQENHYVTPRRAPCTPEESDTQPKDG